MQDQRHLDSNANRSICGLATFLAPCVFVYYSVCLCVCVPQCFDYPMQLTSNQHYRVTHPTGDGRRYLTN